MRWVQDALWSSAGDGGRWARQLSKSASDGPVGGRAGAISAPPVLSAEEQIERYDGSLLILGWGAPSTIREEPDKEFTQGLPTVFRNFSVLDYTTQPAREMRFAGM